MCSQTKVLYFSPATEHGWEYHFMTPTISKIEVVRKMKYVFLDTINAAKTYEMNATGIS